MKTGMLWYDNDKMTDFPNKIETAAAYYRKKYGRTPNICYVNPQSTKSGFSKAGKIVIKTTSSILPNHFWLGVIANDEDKL